MLFEGEERPEVLTGHCVGGKDRTGRLLVLLVRVDIIEGVELVELDLVPRTDETH